MDVINHVAAGPFAAACVLLGYAGISKIRRPLNTQPAAAALGLPDSRAAVRTLGIVELGASAAGLVFGGAGAAGVVVLYAILALAAWRLHVRAPETPCGCIGASTAPASASHVAVNVAAMFVAAVAIRSGSPLVAVGDNGWTVVAFIGLVGCCAALVDVMIESLPALGAAAREGRSA